MSLDDAQHEPLSDDDAVVAAVRRHYAAAVQEIHERSDIDDVRRRFRARSSRNRRVATSLAGVAAALVVVVAAWPGEGEQSVTIREPRESAAARAAWARSDLVRTFGDRPDIIAAQSRDTADGLGIRALLLDRMKDPTEYFDPLYPARCVINETADIVVQYPGRGWTGTWAEIANPPAGAVNVRYLSMYGGTDSGRFLPDGSPDPRTTSAELDPGTSGSVPLPSTGPISLVAVARGDASLRSLRVAYSDGSVDSAVAVDGFAVVAVSHLSVVDALPPGEYPPRVDPALVTLTFADGHTVDIEPDIDGSGQIVGPDGELRNSLQWDAQAAGECVMRTPELPESADGPDDERAARVAITNTIETAAKGQLPLEQRLPAFVDQDRGRRIVEELGEAKVAGAESSTAAVTGISFVSPTEAVVQFDLTLPAVVDGITVPPTMVTGVFGKVVLSDGEWLVTSETICRLLSSVTPNACEGLETRDYPPEVYAPSDR